jgi:succinate dehydrogenase/fumarate reductase-like Fe-S protein
MRRFHIYRCDLERDVPPRMQAYDFEAGDGDRMLLDALIRIKAIDPSLSFRRSCREGVCGSDAMNINGKNGLPCVTNLRVAVRGGAQAAARHAGDPRPDRGPDRLLPAVPFDQALARQ